VLAVDKCHTGFRWSRWDIWGCGSIEIIRGGGQSWAGTDFADYWVWCQWHGFGDVSKNSNKPAHGFIELWDFSCSC